MLPPAPGGRGFPEAVLPAARPGEDEPMGSCFDCGPQCGSLSRAPAALCTLASRAVAASFSGLARGVSRGFCRPPTPHRWGYSGLVLPVTRPHIPFVNDSLGGSAKQ